MQEAKKNFLSFSLNIWYHSQEIRGYMLFGSELQASHLKMKRSVQPILLNKISIISYKKTKMNNI